MVERKYRVMIASVLAMGLTLTACSANEPVGTQDKGAAAEPAASTTAAATRDDAGVRVAVAALFAPYSTQSPPSVQDRAIFTAATTTLINQWKGSALGDEPTFLGDFDWLCQCQDWDEAHFRVFGQAYEWTSANTVIATINYTQMADSGAQLRLMMAREGGAWKIADMEFAEGDKLFTTHLREEIAEARSPAGAAR